MIASAITGFVAGALAGIGGLASHSMAAPGLFTSVQFIDKNNPMSIVWIVNINDSIHRSFIYINSTLWI